MGKILVIEDKASMAQMLKESLELDGYQVSVARDGQEGIRKIKTGGMDLVLTDLKLPGKNGIEVLKTSKNVNPLIPVIVMTAYGTVETAVDAMKLGAFDFITKPLDMDYLQLLIQRALKNRRIVTENILLKDALSHRVGMPDIIGKSDCMVTVAENIRKVSSKKTTVLLLGESGTGKELFARAIHDLSQRNEHPFVAVNCAAIPGDLLESELFGHEKGAFTGAGDRKPGKLELADRGTVFFDEIGEMDLSLQAKVLRAIQEGEIDRVGGTGPVSVDIRIIAATNRDLEKAVAAKRFREDLFYRLSVFPITIPPLRERREDVPVLVEHFLAAFTLEMNIPRKEISPGAMDVLCDYSWKGNVRELENVIERALILCEGGTINKEHLRLANPASSAGTMEGIPLDGTLEEASRAALRIAESRRIKKALEDTHGNKTRAAEILQVSYKTLLTKIKDYKIEK